MNKKSTKIRPFEDQCVIYFSKEDDNWIAHSLRTDQVGIGDCIIDALADLIKAVNSIIKEAAKDQTITVMREAPANIQKLLGKADELPREMVEIAYKKVHGQWPKTIKLEFETGKKNRFALSMTEPLSA